MKKTVLLLFVMFVLVFVSCSSKDKKDAEKVIKIGCLPITHSMPLYLCKDATDLSNKGYKIELVKFNSWTELIDALRLRKIDAANILVELAMRAVETGSELKLVSLSHRDGNVIIGDKSIQSFSDLRGKTIAIPHKMSPHSIMLDIILKQQGIKKDEISIIDLSPAEMAASLSTGSISAYLVAEPFGAMAVTKNIGKVLAWSNEIYPNSACCAIVFNQKFVDKNKSLLNQFLEDYDKASAQANKKDDFVKLRFSEITGVQQEVLDLSFEWIDYNNLNITREEYNTLVNYILEFGMMKQPPKYEDFIFIRNGDENN